MDKFIVFLSTGEILEQESIDSKHLYYTARDIVRSEKGPCAAICKKEGDSRDIPIWVMTMDEYARFLVTRQNDICNLEYARQIFLDDYCGDHAWLDKVFSSEHHVCDDRFLSELRFDHPDAKFDCHTGMYCY